MKQCTRCGAMMEDPANFCGSCGSTEFVAGAAESKVMPNGSGMQQGGPMPGQQVNYQQQGGPMPGYQQVNYQQQGGPMPGYQQPNYQQPPNFFVPYSNVPPDVDRTAVSKSEFLKKYADPGLRKEWKSIGIFFYIACGISILGAIFMSSGLDVLFCLLLLGLALGTHLAVNKVCAIILLVLSSLDTLLCLIAYGTLGGWLWILVGAIAVVKIGKINTQYKQFQYGMPF